MKPLRRALFYIKQTLFDLWFGAVTQSEQEMKDEAMTADNITDEEADLPPIDPAKSMAFHSWSKNIRCNVFTAPKCKYQIISAMEWGLSIGIDTFFADYTTPYGMLALVTLLEERKAHGSYQKPIPPGA